MVELLCHSEATNGNEARVEIESEHRAEYDIDPKLFGKFCEHLGWNVYQGMDAQVLFNPTFGEWKFRATDPSVDGGYPREYDRDKIPKHIKQLADRQDFPESEPLRRAYESGCAFWWMRLGSDEAVTTSPDTNQTNDRAQRVEVHEANDEGRGVFQWTYLPLHRTSSFEYRLKARAPERTSLEVRINRLADDGMPGETITSEKLDVRPSWTTTQGELEIPADAELGERELVAVTIVASEPANFVLDRALVYPDDHINHADPDVIAFLKDLKLPLLRWPGGNFVSNYHWRDGVGPVDERPTKSNPAWGGIEHNLFGTNEFMEFCDAVGCEPLICVNTGSGTPYEAARWVEYCNGSTDTEMGQLRAEDGHPEPYDVTHWEIGNEIYGGWQVRWTTPDGNVDRYHRFRDAMKSVDSDIEVYACGQRSVFESEWNDRLIESADESLSITDHTLPGGEVTPETDPEELFHAYTGYSSQLASEYRTIRDSMDAAGIQDSGLAITEMQLFSHPSTDEEQLLYPPVWFGGRTIDPAVGLPTNKTIAEAIFYATTVNECIRMGEFVDLITHTATVNHGGGLQKHKQRVWADPVHYGQSLQRELAGRTPVHVKLECGLLSTDQSFGEIDPVDEVPIVDAVAAIDDRESELVVLLVHRGSDRGDISLTLDVGTFDAAPTANVTTLKADSVHEVNVIDAPENITPEHSTVNVYDGTIESILPSRSLTRITLEAQS